MIVNLRSYGWRWPIQGLPRLSPLDSWDRLQQTPATKNWISRYRKWMDGWGSLYVSSRLQMLWGHLTFPYSSNVTMTRCAKLMLFRGLWTTGDRFQKVFLWRFYFQNETYLPMVNSENTVYSLPLNIDIQVGDCSETRGHIQDPT